jgi:hypothetical protein
LKTAEPLSAVLADKVGVAFGIASPPCGLTLLTGADGVGDERLLTRVAHVDFALLGPSAFYLADIDRLLAELHAKLVDHGLLVLCQGAEASRSEALRFVHRTLAAGEWEFLADHPDAGVDGAYVLLRRGSPSRAVAGLTVGRLAAGPKPIRYLVADAIYRRLLRFPRVVAFARAALRGAMVLGARARGA